MGNTYGYARVSSADQNEARQLIALQNAGVAKKDIFVEKLRRNGYVYVDKTALLVRLEKNCSHYIYSGARPQSVGADSEKDV